MPKITKRLVDALRPPLGCDMFVWDSELHGYGIRLKPSGRGAFIVQYRTPQRRTRRYAFGRIGALTPDQARRQARRLLVDVDAGGDPSGQRHKAFHALTVADLCERYLEAARTGLVTVRGKPKRLSTIEADEGRIRHHIVPLIGHCPVADLDRAAVQRVVDAIAAGKTAATIKKTKPHGHATISGGGGAAARAVELLGGIWSWAERRGYVEGVNPARRIEKARRAAKDRVLSADELAWLGVVSRDRAATHTAAVNVIRLLALTGLRYGEGAHLRWTEVHQAAGVLRLEESKTGRSVRPVGKPVWCLLESLPRGGTDWVFPGVGTSAAYLRTEVAKLFDAVGIPDARSRDLRRTFASVAADMGFSDGTIGDLLGHARQGVTSRHYIRRADPVLLAAADKVSDAIARMLDGKSVDVLSLSAQRGTPGAAPR